MLGVLFRHIVAFVLTKRGKKVVAFVGAMLLCFLTALLIDLRLYLTAGFTGLLAAATLVAWKIQYQRQRSIDRERERRDAEEAVRRATATQARGEKRAAAAQARGEKMEKAKTAVADAARTVSSGAAGAVDVTKTGLARARDSLSFWRSKRGPNAT